MYSKFFSVSDWCKSGGKFFVLNLVPRVFSFFGSRLRYSENEVNSTAQMPKKWVATEKPWVEVALF